MIENNKEQCFAIRCIVDGVSHSEPFVIFGPPGTGKTITVVESIKQVRFTVQIFVHFLSREQSETLHIASFSLSL